MRSKKRLATRALGHGGAADAVETRRRPGSRRSSASRWSADRAAARNGRRPRRNPKAAVACTQARSSGSSARYGAPAGVRPSIRACPRVDAQDHRLRPAPRAEGLHHRGMARALQPQQWQLRGTRCVPRRPCARAAPRVRARRRPPRPPAWPPGCGRSAMTPSRRPPRSLAGRLQEIARRRSWRIHQSPIGVAAAMSLAQAWSSGYKSFIRSSSRAFRWPPECTSVARVECPRAAPVSCGFATLGRDHKKSGRNG